MIRFGFASSLDQCLYSRPAYLGLSRLAGDTPGDIFVSRITN